MWKKYLRDLVRQYPHPAWGDTHCDRVYHLSLEIADKMVVEVGDESFGMINKDSLYAAAMIHDFGAFDPYKVTGEDHAETSAKIVPKILGSVGFTENYTQLIQEIILGHMFYTFPTDRPEVIVFHDADTLDFLGSIGIARILAIVGIDDWAPDLKAAVKLIEDFIEKLPDKLVTPVAKKMGEIRIEEMQKFLKSLSAETENFDLL